MSQYAGEFALLYDLFYRDKPYEAEAAVVDRLIRQHADGMTDRLLDLACGTGRHAAHLASLGWAVVGVDQSAEMLEVASIRTSGMDVTLVRQDMTQLALEMHNFDAAVCLFDSIGYALANDSIGATLEGVHRHLRPGGVFVVEFWHAPAMLRDYDPLRIREWAVPDGNVMRISRTSLDAQAQIATVDYEVFQLHDDGAFTRWQERHRNRFFLVQEMASLLQSARFQPIQWLAGYDEANPIDETTWHVVVVARAIAPAAV